MSHWRLPLPTKPPKILRTRKDQERVYRPTSRALLQDALIDDLHDSPPSHPGARRSVLHASPRP
mgnify:CR=1 FL=1